MTVAGVLLLLAGGWGLLRLVWGGTLQPLGVVAAAALSFLAGATAVAAVTTLLGVLGMPLWPVVPVLALLAVAGLRHGRPRWAGTAGAGVVGAVALAIGARLVAAAASGRVLMNDEYAIWALRGRSLALTGALDHAVFTNGAAQYQHLDYPLLVPSLVAWADRFSGGADGAALAQVALMAAALAAVAGWGVSRLAGHAAGAAAALLVLVPTGAAAYSLRLYAELPGAALAAATLMLVLVWMSERDDRFLRVAAITTAGALMAKNEAGLYALAALLAAFVLGGRRRKVALAAVAAVAAYIPWIAFRLAEGLENDVANSTTLTPGRLADNAGRVDTIAAAFVRDWPAPWLTLPLLAAAAVLALRAGHARTVAAVALATLAAVAVLAASFYVTPQDVDSHLRSAAARVLVYPAMLSLVAIPLFAGLALRPRAGPG